MKAALPDEGRGEAMLILRELVQRLRFQTGKGLKPRLDGNGKPDRMGFELRKKTKILELIP